MQKMNWYKLMTTEKIYSSSIRVNDNNDRSEFERDHNKIIFSPFFRQLQNKTQLFPITQSDFIHSRLTHSLEVASVGQSLGNLVAKHIIEKQLSSDLPHNFAAAVTTIVGAACLLHDIGNPPFGHAGEEAISAFFLHNAKLLKPHLSNRIIDQLCHFDGNAQALRFINVANDLNLTFATIASVIKYPTVYNDAGIYGKKHSVFISELELFEKIALSCGLVKHKKINYCRHPLAFLVEAADDICYRLLDLEDAHKLGLIKYSEAETLLLQIIESKKNKNLSLVRESISKLVVEDKFARLRSYALNILIGEIVQQFILHYPEIINGHYTSLIVNGKLSGLMDMLLMSHSEVSQALFAIGNLVKNNAYLHPPVLEMELSGYEVLGYLLEQFIGAALNSHNPFLKRSVKLLQLLPERFRVYTNLEQQIMLITDYIASQSDRYAMNLYRKLRASDPPLGS
ncbi:MAG: dNTP triphosphohydrolase [Burkholderiales bacterium]|nr:dNTP triphosphohydrolase [Burkholderiales bacterium]